MTSTKNFSVLFTLFTTIFFIAGCDDKEEPLKITGDYFVFGSYYGECMNNCVNFYVINEGKLYSGANEQYPNKQQAFDLGALTTLDEAKFHLVKDLPSTFPTQLLNESSTVVGCPDCTDGGGVYIEVKVNNEVKFWYIDNFTHMIPEYLRAYIPEMNAKLQQLR
jgi:hypothetical protein